MQDDMTVNDFLYVKETLNSIFNTLSSKPFSHLCEGAVVQCELADVRWMLSHQYYPTPGQIDAFIDLLRNEKFRIVREEGADSVLAEEIQPLIESLKDIHRFLKLVTQYKYEVCIINLNDNIWPNWKESALFLCAGIAIILCIAQVFIFFHYSPIIVYGVGYFVFFSTSLFMEGKGLFFSFSGLVIFTLLSLRAGLVHL